jgi:two-component system phosphate regulon sensor histidine kinase PhoR
LAQAYANTNRLIRLVNTFLNLSRIESDRLTVQKEKHDLIPILKNILDELHSTAYDKGVKLLWETKVDSLMAEVDADKIYDVLINLIDNAIKYTPKGGVVKVKLEDLGNKVRFEVKDTGQGLTPDEIKSLFSKFVRGKGASRLHPSGTGLGLYIAKRIIEMHQGQIGVQSPGIGKGSTFWVEIPKNT